MFWETLLPLVRVFDIVTLLEVYTGHFCFVPRNTGAARDFSLFKSMMSWYAPVD
jgi:hypothetical protein